MAAESPRTTLNRAALVRILSDTVPEAIDPRYDLGERLGQWLDVTTALTLYSALNPRAASQPGTPSGSQVTANALQEQLAKVRQQLSDNILHDGVFRAEAGRIRFPLPQAPASAAGAADFTPYHSYYLAHQREMSATIDTLRGRARKALAAGSTPQRQLAEIDAIFEHALQPQERHLLGMIPLLVAKRFDQRYHDHRATLAASENDDPATWTQPGGWLEAFCHDVQTVLLAELELRLKPVAGLIAALGSTPEHSPKITQ